MRRLLTYIVLVPLAVVVIALSVANRAAVSLSLDPFGVTSPPWAVRAPLFVFLFAALALGVLVGGAATWLRQGKWRQAARSERASAQRLRREVEQLRQQAAAVTAVTGPPADRDAA